MDMPRVGARIRVTLTYGSGTREIYEGVVSRTPDDGLGIVELGSGVRVALNDRLGRTVTVEELEPPKPTLPPEPPVLGVVEVKVDTTSHLFRRLGNHGAVYADLTEESGQESWRWTDLNDLGAPIRWLPVPDLAELVDALRMTVGYWHLSSHGGSDPFGECGAVDCANLRALLAKYEVQS